MSKCDVSIQLANTAPRSARDVVAGEVVVVVDQDVRANHVEVELGWFTHGKGNRVDRAVEKVSLGGGAWSAGRELRFPFRFSIPDDGPVTSRGTLINLDWQVKARVDLPWAIDPKATEDFVVVAGPHSQPLLEQPSGVTGAPPSKAAVGCITAFLAPFVLSGAGVLAIGVHEPSPLPIVPGLMLLVIPGIFLFKVWKAVFAHMAVGNISLSLTPAQAAAGDEVVFAIELPRRIGPRVRGVTATLEGSESAVSGSGTARTTHTETFCEVDVVVTKKVGAAGAGFEGRVRLPGNARATLRVTDNTVLWQVKVNADIDGLPDPSWAREIVVTPSLATAPTARSSASSSPSSSPSSSTPSLTSSRREPGPGNVGRCPICDDVELASPLGHSEQPCTMCGGTFLGTSGVDHFVLAPLGFGPGDLRELIQVTATTSPLCCSSCGVRMKRLPIKGVTVDLCDACGSGWLDAGERERLVEGR
jgi:hypothetical protein